SLDTDKFAEEMPHLMQQALAKSEAANPRHDSSLRHHAMVADMTKEGAGGYYWLVAGGDGGLVGSRPGPPVEQATWNPMFQKLMESLHITRDEELLMRQVANDVMAKLREMHPEEEFEFTEGDRIKGKSQMVYLSNVYREIQESPRRREAIIKNFVQN